MDCEHVGELLDAYALGAAEPDEAAALEEHVADCVRCWSSLSEAQRTAATIALSTALQRAPESLRNRILAETERGERLRAPKLPQLVRNLWPAGAAIVTAGAAASLTFAFFLQAEVNDLNNENDQLVAQVEDVGEMVPILAAPDFEQVSLDATDHTTSAEAIYQWSDSAGRGALLCNNLPSVQEGQEFKVWFMTEDRSFAAGGFQTLDGIGQLNVDLEDLPELPVSIGVSIDDVDARKPGEMFLLAEFQP